MGGSLPAPHTVLLAVLPEAVLTPIVLGPEEERGEGRGAEEETRAQALQMQTPYKPCDVSHNVVLALFLIGVHVPLPGVGVQLWSLVTDLTSFSLASGLEACTQPAKELSEHAVGMYSVHLRKISVCHPCHHPEHSKRAPSFAG